MTDWNPAWGGAERYVSLLRDGLRAAGHEVVLLASSVSADARRDADRTAWASDARAWKSILQIANPWAARDVRAVVREFRPDVALVNMFALYLSPSAVFALGDVPMALLVTDYKIVCPTGAKLLPGGALCGRPAGRACLDAGCLSATHWARDQVRYARIRRAVERAGLILSCGTSLQQTLAADGIRSEVEWLPVEPPAKPASSPASEPRFAFVGRLDAEKGLDTLLMAFALLRRRIPQARLRIVGRGPQREGLEAMADRLGQSEAIAFTGWLEAKAVAAEMTRSWAVIAPSRWAEPQGLVAAEALVLGVPVIVTDHGGLAEQVEPDVGGLHVSPDDVSALAKAMERVARGEVFPTHRLDGDVVARSRTRFDPVAHVGRMLERLARLAGC